MKFFIFRKSSLSHNNKKRVKYIWRGFPPVSQPFGAVLVTATEKNSFLREHQKGIILNTAAAAE